MAQTAFSLELPVELTDSEVAGKSKELAEEIHRHAELEAQKKASATHYANLIKESDRSLARLGREVRTRTEHRLIECTERVNFADRTVDTYRLDTGEKWSSRPIKREEAQMDFFSARMAAPRPSPANDTGPGDDDDDSDDDDGDEAAEN